MEIKHLDDHGFTYCQHFRRAWGLGLYMMGGGILTCVHGICPWWFETIATDTNKVVEKMLNDK